jgi:methylenetetrahydrofolate dehydrogenase (NADP+) / methenyltetrahydrofolate cyclohydrolase
VTTDMAECRVLDGVVVGKAIREALADRVRAVQQALGRPPALGIVLVGEDPGSEVYVRNKVRTGGESGLTVDLIRLPATTSLEAVLGEVRRLNASPDYDGILVQSPLPAALGADAEMTVFETIDPGKDVDGFSPVNVGRLVQNRATLRSCTPAGVMEMLRRCDIPIAGRHAVVIGRSDIVGKPMALMLLHANATVTICHSRTADLPAVAATADILVVAIGRAGFVTPAFVKPGATVIDVGMNTIRDAATVQAWFPADSPRHAEFAKKGSLLVGDVDPRVAAVAGALTPVPRGVGPLTIAMLMQNTVLAAETRLADATRRR